MKWPFLRFKGGSQPTTLKTTALDTAPFCLWDQVCTINYLKDCKQQGFWTTKFLLKLWSIENAYNFICSPSVSNMDYPNQKRSPIKVIKLWANVVVKMVNGNPWRKQKPQGTGVSTKESTSLNTWKTFRLCNEFEDSKGSAREPRSEFSTVQNCRKKGGDHREQCETAFPYTQPHKSHLWAWSLTENITQPFWWKWYEKIRSVFLESAQGINEVENSVNIRKEITETCISNHDKF